MLRCTKITFLFATLLIGSGNALADLPPDIDSIAIPENCGRFTIAPGGGENLHDPEANNYYRIHVQIWSNGDPVTTLAATDIWVENPQLARCPGQFSQADAGTDAEGATTISGTIFGGLQGDAGSGIDCDAAELYVFAMGIVLNYGQPVCVSIDSPDLNGDLTVSIADFGRFAQGFNCTTDCDPCHDYNEDGATTVADFGAFAGYFNQSSCP